MLKAQRAEEAPEAEDPVYLQEHQHPQGNIHAYAWNFQGPTVMHSFNIIWTMVLLLCAHVHGKKSRIPKDALSADDMERVVTFIQNHAEERGVLLPGTIPGYGRDDLKLLPSSSTKSVEYRCCASVCQGSHSRCVAQRTFYALWKTYVLEILPMKPRTDLCGQCQQNNDLYCL